MLFQNFRLLCRDRFVLYIIVSYLSVLHWMADLHAAGNISKISDGELQNTIEELFAKSPCELYRYVSVNYQGQITSKNITDNAAERFLDVSFEALSFPTTKSLVRLFDNYELDTNREEVIMDEETSEEEEFLHNLMATNTMLHTMHFLSAKGFFTNDLHVYKKVLKEIWFSQYSRSKGVNGSSGFEHVFLVEKKSRRGILGLHNWIFFFLRESSDNINYMGFSRRVEFDRIGAIAKVYFTYNSGRKASTMFIGTAPELEMSLYTLCFFARPNRRCKVSFAGINFSIQTYELRKNDTVHVGTAFPII